LAKGRIADLSPARMDSSDLSPLIGSLYHMSQPQINLDQFTRFLHSSPLWPTHRYTDHATCDICSNRPHFTHCVQAMQPKN